MAEAPTQTQQPRPVFYVVFHLGVGGADAGSKPGPAPAPKASIEAMPRIKVKESGSDCIICLEEFEIDEEAREMPCKHVFHSGCIEKWLQIHGTCPVCRFLMPTETVETGGGDSDRRNLEDVEINGLEILHSFLAFASLASLMGVAGSHQPDSGRVDDDTSSNQNADCN
ncbi:putative Ribosomal protein L34e superfamily protein [Hibiscus syriacus]|uniref:RING-type E3 ubiquitin transferase n=1 Tax=Hibiscus syriacus TaxID=106335 RepID=A0A6A3BLZ3_HIBSY|nr:E3 ubiquitin-protein ligase RZF1-like [Hibiscus syriacus]KAE8717087.1 putative Ribosomal protein L34e superfamily protein [Hibiscus syriacus]